MQIKHYLRLGVIILILGLSLALVLTIRAYKSSKADANRNQVNLENSAFTIKTLEAKNKTYYYEINQLLVDKETLTMLNQDLVKRIENLNSKLKNVTAAAALALEYNIRIDSIPIYIRDTIIPSGVVTYSDKYVSLAGIVDWKEKSFEDVNIVVTEDSLLLITETVYKGWWFWRRPKYSKIKIQASNPYLILKNVETYNLNYK